MPPVSGRSKHKSFLQELSFSVQTHSNCKMALIVGFVSLSETMKCKRKMCTSRTLNFEYYMFSNCSLLFTGMPCLPLNCHRHPEAFRTLLVCRSYYTVTGLVVKTITYFCIEWQLCFLSSNLVTFLFLLFLLLFLLSCTSTTLNRNDVSRHIVSSF